MSLPNIDEPFILKHPSGQIYRSVKLKDNIIWYAVGSYDQTVIGILIHFPQNLSELNTKIPVVMIMDPYDAQGWNLNAYTNKGGLLLNKYYLILYKNK